MSPSIIGLFAGLLLGLAGSVIGGVIANLLGTGDIFELNIVGSLVAFASAVVLVVVGEQVGVIRRRTHGD